MLSRILSAVVSGGAKGHFGQWAEDALIRKLFDKNKRSGTYLDLGAFHPFRFSNTASLWVRGWKGINVDANPNSIRLFKKMRPGDTNIWAAVVPESEILRGVEHLDLYLPERASKDGGLSAVGTVHVPTAQGRKMSNVVSVPALSTRQIVEKHDIGEIDYLNIDIEGMDEALVSELDLQRLRPSVVTVEDHSPNLRACMGSAITAKMEEKGYHLVSRAGPTSIFLRNDFQPR